MGSELTAGLWAFATGLYANEDIKQRSLELQDVHSANVCVVLWLCWLDSSDIRLERSELTQALNIVGGMNHELLSGLRDLRSKLIAGSGFTRVQEQLVRKHILAAELAIEKVLLQRLQDLTSRLSRAASDEDCLTLFDYLDCLGVSDSGELAAVFLEHSRNFTSESVELS